MSYMPWWAHRFLEIISCGAAVIFLITSFLYDGNPPPYLLWGVMALAAFGFAEAHSIRADDIQAAEEGDEDDD